MHHTLETNMGQFSWDLQSRGIYINKLVSDLPDKAQGVGGQGTGAN